MIPGGTSGLRKKTLLFQEKFLFTLLSQVDLDFSETQNNQDLELFQLSFKDFCYPFYIIENPQLKTTALMSVGAVVFPFYSY